MRSVSDMASGGAPALCITAVPIIISGSTKHLTRRIVHISYYVQSNVVPTNFSENSVRDLDFQISFGRHGRSGGAEGDQH